MKMRKIVVLSLVILMVAGVVVSAEGRGIGIGAEYVLDFGGANVMNGLAITGSPPKLPIVIGLQFAFGSQVFQFGLTVDWWLFHTNITGPLDLYIGPGLFLNVASALSLGVRVPVGLQWWVITPLELFLEASPSIGITFANPVTPRFGVGLALGGRFWF